jgi:protein gp37
MGSKTKIEWCDATWNPMISRFPMMTVGRGWDGRAHFMPHKLEQPLHWKKSRRISVCSMGDLFHSSITKEQIASVFAVCASCPQHTFIILTKRARRCADVLGARFGLENFEQTVSRESERSGVIWDARGCNKWLYPSTPENIDLRRQWKWPLPNVWIGVSVEDQETADYRIPKLLEIPAEKRFASVEPMLGHVDFRNLPFGKFGNRILNSFTAGTGSDTPWNLNWVICGAETGTGKRPMDLDWARSLRDQCIEANVPFFFKKDSQENRFLDGKRWEQFPK